MSRLYGGKYFDQKMKQRFRVHAESRDAIVWDVDDEEKWVRCKIQNSNEYILCHYPRNLKTLPEFCKRGNAVRIIHRGGVRGHFEIVGHGRAIPTAIAGGDQLPEPQPLSDGIVSGGYVTPWYLDGGDPMGIKVSATSYIIDGELYALDLSGGYAVMNDGLLGLMGAAGNYQYMGSGNTYFVLDAAPAAPNFRYDLFVLGEDENMDYIKGTAGTNPSIPSVPANHIKLCHVFLIGGMTQIEAFHINGILEEKNLQEVTWDPSNGTGTINVDDEFVWHTTNNTPNCNLRVDFKDQYGNAISISDTLTLTKLAGIGQIYSANTGWHSSTVTQAVTGSSYTFKYERDQLGSEISPVFDLQFASNIMAGAYRIQLLDSGGGDIS